MQRDDQNVNCEILMSGVSFSPKIMDAEQITVPMMPTKKRNSEVTNVMPRVLMNVEKPFFCSMYRMVGIEKKLLFSVTVKDMVIGLEKSALCKEICSIREVYTSCTTVCESKSISSPHVTQISLLVGSKTRAGYANPDSGKQVEQVMTSPRFGVGRIMFPGARFLSFPFTVTVQSIS